MSKIIFYEGKGKRKEIEVHPGQTLLEVAREYEIDIEGTCEGNLACATCHLVIDKDGLLSYLKQPRMRETC